MRFVCLLVILFSSPVLIAQTFSGAKLQHAPAAQDLRGAVARAQTEWVAWTVPSTASVCCSWQKGGCCGSCALDGRGLSINDDATHTSTTITIAARVNKGVMERLRVFGSGCSVAADGASITLFSDVSPEASIAFLREHIEEKDADDAISVLALHDHPRAVDTLIALARNGRSTRVRRDSLFWLGQKAGEKAAGELRHAVDHDPKDEVREHAVFAISQLPRDRAVPMLIDLVKTHKSRKVRERAMFWLSQTGDARALDLMEEILTR